MTSVADELIDLGRRVAVAAVGADVADGMFEREGSEDD